MATFVPDSQKAAYRASQASASGTSNMVIPPAASQQKPSSIVFNNSANNQSSIPSTYTPVSVSVPSADPMRSSARAMPGEVAVAQNTWQNTSKSTIDKAKDSTIAYKADGSLDAAATVRNIFNDLKSIKTNADKENKANPVVDTQFSETSRGLVRTDSRGKQTLVRDAAGNYVAPVRDVTKDTGHKVSLKESAEAARQSAVMGGMETSKIPMSYSQENLADQIKKYQNMTFGAKMKANIGNTALNVGADLANAALTVPKYFGGEKVHNNSIYAVTNFLQEGVSGNTTLNTANMLETSNWLGKLVLQLEGTTVEQAIDLAAGGGAGSLIVMGSRVFGSSTREAEAEGKSVGKQLLTGLTRSGVEIVTELLGGVGGSYRGTGYGDAIFQNLDKWVADKTNSELLGTIASAFGSEATEEMVSDILNPIFDRLFKLSDGDTTLLQDIWGDGQILYDGLLGGLAGGFGSVTTAGGNYSAAKQLGVDVATYKVAERIVENKDARKRFEGYTGIKLDSDKDFAIAQAAVTLTANSNGDTTVREIERDILKGDKEGVTYRNTLGAYLRAVNDANASLYNTVLMNAANSNDENVRAFADGIIRGKYAVNNANLGELAIMMEKSGDGSVRDIVQSAAKDLSGAQVMKYVNAAKSKAQQEYETMVSENPGKKVFNPIEQKLHDTTGWSAAKVEQQSGILAKVFSGVQYMTDADYKALDLNNTQVQQIFKEYTGIDISMARDDASRRALLELAADAAVDTERYQQDLRDANEQFVNGRTAEILSPYEAQIKESAKSAYAGTDLAPGRATSKNNNRYVIPPNRVAQATPAKQANKATAKSKTSTVAKSSSGSYTGSAIPRFSHDEFVRKYMERNKVSEAEAEAQWEKYHGYDTALNGPAAQESKTAATGKQEKKPAPKKAQSKPKQKATVKEAADNGRTGETVRSDNPVRQSDMADGGSVSEVQSGNAGSQQTADTGRRSAEAEKPSAPASDVREAGEDVTPEAGYIEEANYSNRQQKFVADLKADGFENVRLAYSELKNSAGQDINAVVRGGDLTIRWSNDADMYADHERIHRWVKAVFGKNPVKRKEFVMRTLRNAVSEDVLTDMYAKYYDEYAKAYSSDVETYTERFGEEQASSYLEGLIYEEILCDMYAGIDYNGTNGNRYTYKIEPLIEMSGIREQALKALGMKDTKGTSVPMSEARMTGTNAAEEEETAMPPEENMSIPEAAPVTEAQENISEAVSPITENTENLSTETEETAVSATEEITNEQAESTSVDDNPGNHTAAEQEIIEAYKAAVDADLVDFAERAIAETNSKLLNSMVYELKPVSDRAASDIKSITGIDAAEQRTVIDGSSVQHIDKRHGKNGEADRSMSDVNDIARIQYILDNYDNAAPGKKSSGYRTSKNSPSKTIVFSKAVDNTYYVVEAVPDTKAKTIYIVSAYMEKRKNGESDAPGDYSSGGTSEKTYTASTPSSPPSDIKTGITAESGVTGAAESVVEENSSINNMPEISENVNTEIETDNQVTVNEEKTETTTAPVDSTNQEQEAEQINATNEVPPTAETEEAKTELKKAVRMPIKGTNMEALLAGIKSKELSMDSISYPRDAKGFNSTQLFSLINGLIDGVYSDRNVIKISVPYDGKFEIENTPATVAKILNELGVKVTQDIIFTKQTDSIFRNGKAVITEDGGKLFLSDGAFIIPINNATAEYAASDAGYKAETRNLKLNGVLNGDGNAIDSMPAESKSQKVLRVYVNGTPLYFNMKYIRLIKGSYYDFVPFNKVFLLRSYDEKGNLVGAVLPMHPDNKILNAVDWVPTSEKGFQNKTKPEVRTTSTEAPVANPQQSTAQMQQEYSPASEIVPETETPAETPSEIADFGEKIGGARKDLWAERGMLLSDLDSMTEVEKGKYIKKDNVWPKADYAAMVEAGAEKDAVYFVKLVHDALPAAPQFRPTDTGETIQRRREDYITIVQIVRDVMSNVKTKQDAISAFNKVFVDNGYYYRNNAYDHGWTSKGRANLSITSRLVNALSTARSWNYDVVNKMNKAQFLVSKEDKLPNGVSVKFYDGSGYSRDNSWQPNTWYVAKGYSIIQFNFEDEASARKWAQENLSKSAPANGKVRFVPKQLESVHRVGKNYRDNNTRNITGEDYMTTFGFRGGEFGNWVNQNERQISLNYGYDALMDLADALGISADDISLGGKLSIAFGARGRAGAAAHFEPERNVINLTKMNGAGTLAHEWAHALDYIVGQSLGARERMTGDLRKVNIPALNKLMEDMKYRPVSEEEAADQAKKANERALKRATYQINSWVTNVNDTAQQEVKRAEFMAKLPAADSWESASALAEEISAYRKETTGRIIPKEDRENLARAIYVAASPATAANGKTRTDFYSMSEKFDKQYSKQDKGYWSSDVEMFARAFACYITDKLSSGDLKSDYLSGHSDTSASILFNPDGTTEPIYAYPRGDERARLNKDFDELIAALKENGSLTAAPPRANNFTTEAYAEGTEDYDIVRYSVADPSYKNDPVKRDILNMVQAADNDPEEFARILGEWANMYANSPAPKTEQQTTRYVIPPANAISEEKQKANRNQLDGLIEKYGGLPTGENPARDFEAPTRKDDGTYVYRFLRTAAEASGTPDSMIPQIEQQILSAAGSYVRMTDAKAMAYAEKEFAGPNGYQNVKDDWNRQYSNPDKTPFPTKNDIALGEKLYIEAANIGDTAQAVKTLADLAAMATQAGQIVQAMRMLKMMGPSGQLYYIQKAVDRLNKQFEQRLAKNGQTIEINQDLAEDVLLAGDDAEAMDAAMDALIADIANQVPATLKDKIDAWRYLGMLGNARTHIRNIFGNVVFVPVRFTKDILSAVGERRIDQSQRTKSAEVLLNPGKYKAVREFAAADFDENQQSISGNGKYNPTNAILQKRKVFKSKALNTLSEKNSDLLEREDARFLRRAYVSAMSQFLVARDVDIENADEKVMNEARQYATLEAQKATYRDASAVASALNRLAQTNKALGFGLDAVLPFKQTPVNILKRGVEYSPVGLIKSATYGLAQVKSGKITAAEFIDNLASGMTGTMVAALGIWLASLGIARGPGDDDKEGYLESTQGQQDYSLVIGDLSFTIDWLAPVSLPFFVGVQAYKLYNESEDLNAWDIYDALSLVAEPMLSLSMLDGINNLIQSAAYSENNAIPTLIGSAATSYASQFIPTILGQFARTFDADRRTNYVDKNKDMPANTQRFIQNIQGKIPSIGLLPALGLKGIGSKEKMAYVDLWGRKDTNSNIVFRAFENFVSPGYINRIKETPVDTELMRLARATGNNDVLPSEAAKQFTIDSKLLNLTADQYEQYAISRGQMAYFLLEDLINSSYYKAMGDDLRAKTVKYALDYATAVAKADVIPDYTPSTKWMARANEAGYAEEAIIYQALSNTMDITGNKLVAQMDLIGDEAKGHLILASYSDQNSITDPARKGYKYMLDDTSKAILRDLYDYYFWPEYYNTVYYDARYAYGDLQARVDILTELGENVRKEARTELARELSAAGFASEPGEAEIPLISDYLNW